MIPHSVENRRSPSSSNSPKARSPRRLSTKISSPKGKTEGGGGGGGGSNNSGGGLFPVKLHNLLDHAEKHGLQHIISWTDDGLAFVIHDTNKLVELLPLFFGQTKYRSFYRQMNMWSFERIQGDTTNDGAGVGVSVDIIKFRHPFFRKGQKHICQHMCREIFQQTNPINMKRNSATSSSSTSTTTTTTTATSNVAAGGGTKAAAGGRTNKEIDVASAAATRTEGDETSSGKVKSKRLLKRALSDQSPMGDTRKPRGGSSSTTTSTKHHPNKRRHSDRSDLKSLSSGGLLPGSPALRCASDSSLYQPPRMGSSSGGVGVGGGDTFLTNLEEPVDDDIFDEEGDLMEFEGRPFYFVDWEKEDTSNSRSLMESIHHATVPPQHSSSNVTQIPSPTPLPPTLPNIDVTVDRMSAGRLLSASPASTLPTTTTEAQFPPSMAASLSIQQQLQALYAIHNIPGNLLNTSSNPLQEQQQQQQQHDDEEEELDEFPTWSV